MEPKAARCFGVCRLHVSPIHLIAFNRNSLGSAIGKSGRRLGRQREIAVPQRDACARRDQALGDGAADSLRAAGHDSRAALKVDDIGHCFPQNSDAGGL